MERLDAVPIPELELVVGRLRAGSVLNRGAQAEEPGSGQLSAVEQEKRRRSLEVLASGVTHELGDRPVHRRLRVELVVALELAEHQRRIADEVQTVEESPLAAALQAAESQMALLEEVLAVGLTTRARRIPERSHVGLEELGVHIGLGVPALLGLGYGGAW